MDDRDAFGLPGALIRDCRRMAAESCAPPPSHLYSHMQGTFLDEILDAVDAAAKRAAKASVHRVGWIRGLQPPSVCFVREGTQIHHPKSALRRDLTNMHQGRYPTERQGASVGYSQYAMVVKASVLTNEDHSW